MSCFVERITTVIFHSWLNKGTSISKIRLTTNEEGLLEKLEFTRQNFSPDVSRKIWILVTILNLFPTLVQYYSSALSKFSSVYFLKGNFKILEIWRGTVFKRKIELQNCNFYPSSRSCLLFTLILCLFCKWHCWTFHFVIRNVDGCSVCTFLSAL